MCIVQTILVTDSEHYVLCDFLGDNQYGHIA